MQGDKITINELEVAVKFENVEPLVLALLIEATHVGGASVIDLAGFADELAIVNVANGSSLPGTSFQEGGGRSRSSTSVVIDSSEPRQIERSESIM